MTVNLAPPFFSRILVFASYLSAFAFSILLLLAAFASLLSFLFSADADVLLLVIVIFSPCFPPLPDIIGPGAVFVFLRA